MFDIYLLVVVLIPALVYFVSPFPSDGAKSLAGVVSQRTGRGPFLIWTGALMAVAATFFYYLLLSSLHGASWGSSSSLSR